MKKIAERDGLRGLVPAREDGARDKAYISYLNELNPRHNEDIQIALASAEDVRFQEFFDRVTSHKYRAVNMATIAKGCNISLLEFQTWWQKASVQKAIAIAQTRSLKITSDIAYDAESRVVACERCDGLTWIAAPPGLPPETPGYRCLEEGEQPKWIRDCPNCSQGKIRKPGDAHARDKILEMSGLIQKGKGFQIIQNFGSGTHASAVSALDDVMTIDVDSV